MQKSNDSFKDCFENVNISCVLSVEKLELSYINPLCNNGISDKV